MYNYIGLEPRREAMHWQFREMKFGEMKRNTSNWSNFGMLLRRAGLTASAGLSCLLSYAGVEGLSLTKVTVSTSDECVGLDRCLMSVLQLS